MLVFQTKVCDCMCLLVQSVHRRPHITSHHITSHHITSHACTAFASSTVGGELDDEQSTTSPVDSERVSTDRMGSLEEGRRLTLKTLRIMQRGLSGMVPGAEGGGSGGAGAGGDTSFGGSFSRDSCDFNDDDDDDDISVIDMDFWIIPNGWEEYFDTDSQCSYYLNTITQVSSKQQSVPLCSSSLLQCYYIDCFLPWVTCIHFVWFILICARFAGCCCRPRNGSALRRQPKALLEV